RAAFTLVNTALAFPTVVTGLLLFGLLSRRGPLGGLGWLYTWQAIALGDVCIALPIAAALSAAAVQGVDPRIRRTAQRLGAWTWSGWPPRQAHSAPWWDPTAQARAPCSGSSPCSSGRARARCGSTAGPSPARAFGLTRPRAAGSRWSSSGPFCCRGQCVIIWD